MYIYIYITEQTNLTPIFTFVTYYFLRLEDYKIM